jgi:hypothetical protein
MQDLGKLIDQFEALLADVKPGHWPGHADAIPDGPWRVYERPWTLKHDGAAQTAYFVATVDTHPQSGGPLSIVRYVERASAEAHMRQGIHIGRDTARYLALCSPDNIRALIEAAKTAS